MAITLFSVVAVIVCVFLLALLIKILKTPLKWAFKLLIHAASGFIALFILNFVGALVGFSLTINLVNCLVAGFLGLPGVILLVLLKYVF